MSAPPVQFALPAVFYFYNTMIKQDLIANDDAGTPRLMVLMNMSNKHYLIT